AVTPSIIAADKFYDGNDTASVTCSLTGAVANVDVSCSAASASFASSDAGTWTVMANGITLSGGAAGNYLLSSTTAQTSAAIKRATLTVMASSGPMTYGGVHF